MSFLGTALQRISDERGLSQSDVARQSGVSRSYLSRVFGGESQDLSDQHFVAVLKVFAADPKAQAEIIAARCTDVLHPAKAANIAGAALVEIKLHGGKPSDRAELVDAPHAGIQLTKEAEKTFSWLRSQCPLRPDLQRHLIDTAKLLGMR